MKIKSRKNPGLALPPPAQANFKKGYLCEFQLGRIGFVWHVPTDPN